MLTLVGWALCRVSWLWSEALLREYINSVPTKAPLMSARGPTIWVGEIVEGQHGYILICRFPKRDHADPRWPGTLHSLLNLIGGPRRDVYKICTDQSPPYVGLGPNNPGWRIHGRAPWAFRSAGSPGEVVLTLTSWALCRVSWLWSEALIGKYKDCTDQSPPYVGLGPNNTGWRIHRRAAWAFRSAGSPGRGRPDPR